MNTSLGATAVRKSQCTTAERFYEFLHLLGRMSAKQVHCKSFQCNCHLRTACATTHIEVCYICGVAQHTASQCPLDAVHRTVLGSSARVLRCILCEYNGVYGLGDPKLKRAWYQFGAWDEPSGRLRPHDVTHCRFQICGVCGDFQAAFPLYPLRCIQIP